MGIDGWLPVTAGLIIATSLASPALTIMVVSFTEHDLKKRPIATTSLTAFLFIWLAVATWRALTNQADPALFPLLLFGPLLIAAALMLLPAWRVILRTIPIEALIAIQGFRVVGGVFLIAFGSGVVPREFALPAAWGDIATGLLALPTAWIVYRRRQSWRFCAGLFSAFGLADLINAVGIGTGLLQDVSAAIFGSSEVTQPGGLGGFPLALIPTFLVPQAIILHLMVFTKLARRDWSSSLHQTDHRKDYGHV